MPGGDRTGPMGMGPRSGRGMGFCAGYGAPGSANPGRGGGFFGWGGGGRGWRHWFRATGLPGWLRFGWGTAPDASDLSAETQRNFLQHQAELLQRELDAVRSQLDALSARDKAKS